jgi:uncharacterized protein
MDSRALSRQTLTRREILTGLIAAPFFPLAKGDSPAMEQRISLITLGVKSLEASKKFYAEGFGWKPAFESKEIIFFQTSGMIFALFPREELAADFQGDAAEFGRAAMALAYNVRAKNEVNPLIERAVAAGAKLLKPAKEAVWGGYSGYFSDPDGFAWEIAWNPHWQIAADGSVKLGSM